MTWHKLATILPPLVNLRELSLAGCGLTTCAGAPTCSTLRVLHLNRNRLVDWASHVEPLSAAFPALDTLGLTGNPIKEITCRVAAPAAASGASTSSPPPAEEPPSSGDPTQGSSGSSGSSSDGSTSGDIPFATLRTLHVSDTALEDWSSISAIGRFPRLRWVELAAM